MFRPCPCFGAFMNTDKNNNSCISTKYTAHIHVHSPWANRGPHAPPPPMILHEWYKIVQWTLSNDLSDVVTI